MRKWSGQFQDASC